MDSMEITLPGGLPLNGGLERRARFRPLTGRIEQALIESGNSLDRPGFVTAVLDLALERIGSRAAMSRLAACTTPSGRS